MAAGLQTPPEGGWRQGVAIGGSAGVAIVAGKQVNKAVEPDVGGTGAFIAGLFAALVAGGVFALVATKVLARVGRGREANHRDSGK